MTAELIVVLGGTRSGKSAIAEQLAAERSAEVTYVATAQLRDGDANHADRIRRHQAGRPPTWRTVECTDAAALPAEVSAVAGVVLLDSLGTWVTNHADMAMVDAAPLAAALAGRNEPTIVVSEEVGLAVHPPSEMGRLFVDAMGEVNQAVAAVATRVILVVAGRTLELS